MEQRLREAVRQLRLGMEGAGSQSLIGFVDALVGTMADPRTAPLSPSDLPLLQDIIAGQQRGDFLYVADLLEHEILPRLLRADL